MNTFITNKNTILNDCKTKNTLFLYLGTENTATRGAYEKTVRRSLTRGMYHLFVTPQIEATSHRM